MTAQESLWAEPTMAERFPVGTHVRSAYTGNTGIVVAVESGVPSTPSGFRLTIAWDATPYRDAAVVTHGTDGGLELTGAS